MTELVACAVAVTATPGILFGIEQAQRRLEELNDQMFGSRGPNSGSTSAPSPQQQSDSETPEEAKSKKDKKFVPAQEKTPEVTSGVRQLSWTERIDDFADQMDKLAAQRSKELNNAILGLFEGVVPQTPPKHSARRHVATQCDQFEYDSDSTKDDARPYEEHECSKVSFQGESPEVTYIFHPAEGLSVRPCRGG
jgi:hypothetical protein